VTLTHSQWMDLAAEEYRRILTLIAELSDSQWAAPTDCAGWAVRDIVAHLAGAAAATASLREQLRQQRIGAREKGGRPQIDAVNDLQVRERAGLGNRQLRQQLEDLASRSVEARRRTPGLVRALRFRFPAPVGSATVGFLNDVVHTRDAWMHRIDICRAVEHPVELTDQHDGLIVLDAARAWLDATGAPGITLTGPLGAVVGRPSQAPEGTVRVDAVEFARALSGRARVSGVASDVVLF